MNDNIFIFDESGTVLEGIKDKNIRRVRIPSSVTSIGAGAFEGCTNLTSVTIPDGVTSILGGAFSYCTKLESIVIPQSVTRIGNYAFGACWKLKSVTIPENVMRIGDGAFFLTDLTEVTIPESVTIIGEHVFSHCKRLKTVSIPDSVTSIGNGALRGCSSLQSVTIPDSVISIGNGAFSGCTSLTSIDIPSRLTSIGSLAFENCSSLNIVKLQCKTVGSWFRRNTSIKQIIIGDEVTSIGDEAFAGCSNLTSVILSHSLKSIGEWAFYGCSKLESFTIPENVIYIGGWAFYGCSGLTSITIPDSVTSIGEWAFRVCSRLEAITIPDGVTNIGIGVFYNCSSLVYVKIGNNVTNIGERAFSKCSSLTSIKVDKANPKYDSRNDCNAIIETSTNTLIVGCKNAKIPKSVKTIGDYAFAGCTDLTFFTIPNHVTTIGNYAFIDCTRLLNISIPKSIVSIGEGAFKSCPLKEVDLPKSAKFEKNSFNEMTIINLVELKLIEKFVRDEYDIIGHIAYSLYKHEKLAFIQHIKDGTCRAPTEMDMIKFDNHCNNPKEIERYREIASLILDRFVNEIISDTLNHFVKTTNNGNLFAHTHTNIKGPVTFSYSWDNEEHKAWVKKLATDIENKGIDVILDQKHLGYGEQIPTFFERSISGAKRVLCIMTPNYKIKADNEKDGVGYEFQIIRNEIQENKPKNKFIPILREGSRAESCPRIFQGSKYFEFKKEDDYDKKLEELVEDILNKTDKDIS